MRFLWVDCLLGRRRMKKVASESSEDTNVIFSQLTMKLQLESLLRKIVSLWRRKCDSQRLFATADRGKSMRSIWRHFLTIFGHSSSPHGVTRDPPRATTLLYFSTLRMHTFPRLLFGAFPKPFSPQIFRQSTEYLWIDSCEEIADISPFRFSENHSTQRHTLQKQLTSLLVLFYRSAPNYPLFFHPQLHHTSHWKIFTQKLKQLLWIFIDFWDFFSRLLNILHPYFCHRNRTLFNNIFHTFLLTWPSEKQKHLTYLASHELLVVVF